MEKGSVPRGMVMHPEDQASETTLNNFCNDLTGEKEIANLTGWSAENHAEEAEPNDDSGSEAEENYEDAKMIVPQVRTPNPYRTEFVCYYFWTRE